MKGWQATLALISGLFLGVGIWFGFMWLAAPSGSPPARLATAAPDLDAPMDVPGAPSGIARATAEAVEALADGPPHADIIAEQTEELAAVLAAAPWIGRGGRGKALYIVAFRDCPACRAIMNQEVASLEAAGVDVRWILYVRRDRNGEVRSTPAEIAAVATLTRKRDLAHLEKWMSDEADIAVSAENSAENLAMVERVRALVDRLSAVVTGNGLRFAVPALFWQEGGTWRFYVGYDAATFAEVRAGLGVRPSALPQGAPSPR